MNNRYEISEIRKRFNDHEQLNISEIATLFCEIDKLTEKNESSNSSSSVPVKYVEIVK